MTMPVTRSSSATATRAVAAAVVAGCIVTTGCADRSPAAPSGATSSPDVVPVAAPAASVPAGAPAPVVAIEPVPANRPRAAVSWLSIPSIGVRDLRVVPYAGQPDDVAGTAIEERGLAASPQGRDGEVGPGTVGNFVVTAHRTSAGAPLRRLPELAVGAHVLVRSGGVVYDYVVTTTMSVSFRSRASMALQTAAVPGHPGLPATQPMITISTCATPEDHAAGDWWHDALGNPEHRIDKVGVLVAVRSA
jgi:sortase A